MVLFTNLHPNRKEKFPHFTPRLVPPYPAYPVALEYCFNLSARADDLKHFVPVSDVIIACTRLREE